jgi:hypothetical protein|nr:MAG TPA: putative nucleotidyltransferase [Caudoviricetes sp.]
MNEDFVLTKEEKVNKLFKVLNVLRNSLQCKRMVVGGSMAMYVHGFCVEPHDLDIEIEGISDESLRALSTMARINKDMKSDILSEYVETAPLYRIRIEDVDVDIWAVNKIDYNRTVFYNNIEFGDVLSVIKKKMDMKREKDYKSLVDYINQLTYFTK